MSTAGDLAAAGSAQDLIHGDAEAVLGGAHGMLEWAGVLEQAAAGFSKLDVEDWTGSAADAFRAKFAPHPKKWGQAAEAFRSAGNAILEYGYALQAAQGHAATALDQFRQAERQTGLARDAWEARSLANQVSTPFVDPAAGARSNAIGLLEMARRNVDTAGHYAHDVVKAATADAPHKPSAWDSFTSGVRHGFDDAVSGVKHAGQWGYNHVLVPGVNGTADLLAAIGHNPTAVTDVSAGLALAAVGGVIDGAGFALDTTVVGAPAGVAIEIPGTAIAAAGLGLAGAGVADTFSKAGSENMQIMHQAGSDGPGSWEPVNESMSPSARDYQERITGQSSDFTYKVNGVKFDGYADGKLIDAKGPGYGNFLQDSSPKFKDWYTGANDLVDQARRQVIAANGQPVVWHVADEQAVPAMRQLLARARIPGIEIVWTP